MAIHSLLLVSECCLSHRMFTNEKIESITDSRQDSGSDCTIPCTGCYVGFQWSIIRIFEIINFCFVVARCDLVHDVETKASVTIAQKLLFFRHHLYLKPQKSI